MFKNKIADKGIQPKNKALEFEFYFDKDVYQILDVTPACGCTGWKLNPDKDAVILKYTTPNFSPHLIKEPSVTSQKLEKSATVKYKNKTTNQEAVEYISLKVEITK